MQTVAWLVVILILFFNLSRKIFDWILIFWAVKFIQQYKTFKLYIKLLPFLFTVIISRAKKIWPVKFGRYLVKITYYLFAKVISKKLKFISKCLLNNIEFWKMYWIPRTITASEDWINKIQLDTKNKMIKNEIPF